LFYIYILIFFVSCYNITSRSSIHFTASSLTWWMSCMVPVNARKGHSFTMCLVVCDSCPQSHDSELRSPHLNIMWPLLPCVPVLMRFSIVHICLASSNPGCLEAGFSISLCTSGFSDVRSCCQLQFFFYVFPCSFKGGWLDFSRSTSSTLEKSLWIVSFGSWYNGKSLPRSVPRLTANMSYSNLEYHRIRCT